MFKVSFKETPECPCKVVTKVGNRTTVILKGTAALPAFWRYIPEEISKWIGKQHFLEIYEDIAYNRLIVYSTGESRCNPEDRYNSVIGERLAEARAKHAIYKFFYKLACKMEKYYTSILYGSIMADVQKYGTLCENEEAHQVKLVQDGKHE